MADSKITLEGYQISEFTPNSHEAPRFESFDQGMMIMNVKFLIDNGQDDDISIPDLKGRLILNNGKEYMLDKIMLSPYKNNETVDKGETGESVLTYILDKENYEKIWQDKSFELEFGPLLNPVREDLSKGKTIEFELIK